MSPAARHRHPTIGGEWLEGLHDEFHSGVGSGLRTRLELSTVGRTRNVRRDRSGNRLRCGLCMRIRLFRTEHDGMDDLYGLGGVDVYPVESTEGPDLLVRRRHRSGVAPDPVDRGPGEDREARERGLWSPVERSRPCTLRRGCIVDEEGERGHR